MTISRCFERFKFNSLTFQTKTMLPTTQGGLTTVGISDDVDPASGFLPNAHDILEYRTSKEERPYVDINLRWSPMDKSKWYYVGTNQDTNPDPRFQNPCSYYLSTTFNPTVVAGTAIYQVDVQYSITFVGGCPPNGPTIQGYVDAALPPTPGSASPSLQPNKSTYSMLLGSRR
jgi:hypothetical protein